MKSGVVLAKRDNTWLIEGSLLIMNFVKNIAHIFNEIKRDMVQKPCGGKIISIKGVGYV